MKSKKEIPLLIASLGCRISSLIIKYFSSLVIVVGVLYVIAYMTATSLEGNVSSYNRNVISNTVWFLQLIGYVGILGFWSTNKYLQRNSLSECLEEAIFQERVGKRKTIEHLIIEWFLIGVSIFTSLLVHSYIIIWAFSKVDCMKYMMIYSVVVVLTYVISRICCNAFQYSWKQLRYFNDERYRKLEIATIQMYLKTNHWRLVEVSNDNGTIKYKHPCCPEGMEVTVPQIKEHEDYYYLVSRMLSRIECAANKCKPIYRHTGKGTTQVNIFKKRKFPVSVLTEIIKLEQEEVKDNETV